MAYIHRWNLTKPVDVEKFGAASAAIGKMLAVVAGRGLKLGNAKGEEAGPEISAQIIAFNGVGSSGQDPFVVKYGSGEGSCRTDRKPYDVAVVAALIILKHIFDEAIQVSSDGKEADWEDGKKVCHDVFGYGHMFHFNEDGLMEVTEPAV